MDGLSSFSDLYRDIREEGYSVESEILEGGVKQVTIERIHGTEKTEFQELPAFLEEELAGLALTEQMAGMENGLEGGVEGRIENLVEHWGGMSVDMRTQELSEVAWQLCRDADIYIRGIYVGDVEGKAGIPEDLQDGLVYISNVAVEDYRQAQAIIQSIRQQVDAYRTEGL